MFLSPSWTLNDNGTQGSKGFAQRRREKAIKLGVSAALCEKESGIVVMKIEYLHEGASDCPLIRIFGFTIEELGRLLGLFLELGTEKARLIAFHDLPFVHCVAACRFTLYSDDKDEGVVMTGDKVFEWRRTMEGWQEIHELAEPLLAEKKGIQWLDEKGTISVLLSQSGLW